MNRLIATAAGLAALGQAQAAQAQAACVDRTDLDDTIVYAMPLAYDAAVAACVGRFSPNGFMATSGNNFIEGFRDRQDATWPGAFRLLKTFMTQSKDKQNDAEIVAMLSALPEENLRPFVDGIITQMIVSKIQVDDCEKIERGMELVSPLPVENVSGLVTFIAEQADLKNPELCAAPTEQSAE